MRWKLRPSLWLSILALAVLGIFALFETLITPYDPLAVEFLPLAPPSWKNPFGTDNLGRDVFSRFVAGARISFVVGLTSVFFAALLGIVAGLISAYFKRVQAVFMRIMDAIWAFPMLLLAMALAASLRPGIITVIIAIALVYSPLFARLVYAQALSLLEREFILAAQAFGCKPARLLFTHVLPNLAAPVIVQATLTVGTAILFITHDLGVIAETARRVIVMYAGKIVEQAPVADIFENPCHPYTRGLLGSIPSDQAIREKSKLTEIKGMVPSLWDLPPGCAFHPRCPQKLDICLKETPGFFEPAPGHQVNCWLFDS